MELTNLFHATVVNVADSDNSTLSSVFSDVNSNSGTTGGDKGWLDLMYCIGKDKLYLVEAVLMYRSELHHHLRINNN